MFSNSDEGKNKGVSLFQNKVKTLLTGKNKVPNIGWRDVYIDDNNSQKNIFSSLSNYKFYFMHKFCVRKISLKKNILYSDCNEKFVAGFKKDNIIGLQFHPEKSYKSGDEILKIIISSYVSN